MQVDRFDDVTDIDVPHLFLCLDQEGHDHYLRQPVDEWVSKNGYCSWSQSEIALTR